MIAPQDNRRLVPLSIMARRLGVRRQYLRMAAEKGLIPAARIGEDFVFNAQAVEERMLELASRPAEGVSDG